VIHTTSAHNSSENHKEPGKAITMGPEGDDQKYLVISMDDHHGVALYEAGPPMLFSI
jgi:hypothetical protein